MRANGNVCIKSVVVAMVANRYPIAVAIRPAGDYAIVAVCEAADREVRPHATQVIEGGTPRYPVGTWPILDPTSKEVLVDGEGRRSYSTSTSYCPSLGEHAVMGYLPFERARVGEKLMLEYFDEGGDGHYPMTVRIVGRGSLFDPGNLRVRG